GRRTCHAPPPASPPTPPRHQPPPPRARPGRHRGPPGPGPPRPGPPTRGPPRARKWGPPALAAPQPFCLNAAMQFRRPKIKPHARRASAGIAAAPMMAVLALISIAITLVVALGTVKDGRLPASGSIGL